MRHGTSMGDMFEIQRAVAALPASMRVMLMRSGDNRLGRYCPECGKVGKKISYGIGPVTYKCRCSLEWVAKTS